MPKSQHPYFVCAQHPRDPMLEEPQENQHIPQDPPQDPMLEEPQEVQHMQHMYEYDQQYRWNVDVATPQTPLWIGLNRIARILTDMQTLDLTRPLDSQARYAELSNELIINVPGIILNTFRILSQGEAREWPHIVWDFECFQNGLNVISHQDGGNHRISFNWGTEEYHDEDDDVWSTLRVITVQYTGQFELEKIPE